MKATDTIQIAEGVQLPVIGFGVYASDPELCVASCKTALEAGYRQIDSAGYYANEHLVGQAIKQAGISRSDVFITTKIIAPPSSMDAEECYEQLVEGVNKFGLGQTPPPHCRSSLPRLTRIDTRLRRPLPHPHAEFGSARSQAALASA